MPHLSGRPPRDEHGAVAIMVAVLATTLFVVAALVVDLGLARDNKRQAQNTADASALAAANRLYLPATAGGCDDQPCLDDAVDAAIAYAQVNFGVSAGDWTGCSDPDRPAGYQATAATPCISFDDLADPRTVRVRVPDHSQPALLAGAAGVEEITVSARAAAGAAPGLPGVAACGLCVLENTNMSGTPGIEVSNSNIHLNRSNFSGVPTLATTGQFITTAVPTQSGNPTLPPRVAGPVPPDPLAHLALPFTAAAAATPNRGNVSQSGNGSCTLQPGRYGSLSLSGNKSCTMAPGLYTFTGTVSLSGSSRLDASSGVTFYFTCGTSANPHECGATYPFVEYGGSLNLSGTNDVDIVAPHTGSAWDGLAIVYDRGNGNNLDYSGTNQKTLRGSVYAKGATLNLSGTADSSGFDSLVVVKNLNVSGNGTIKLVYTAPSNPTMPTLQGEISLSQ